MKTILLGMLLISSALSTCKAQNRIVGEIIDGKNVITVSNDSLLKIGNKILKAQQVEGRLSSVSIEKDFIEDSQTSFYYLRFANANNSVKLVQVLKEAAGKFSTLQSTLEAGTSVSCTGCRKGCDPKRYMDRDGQLQFYCNDCTLGDTKDCKKTESQGSTDL